MTYLHRRWSHERRVVHLGVVDPLVLDHNYLLDSGSTFAQSVVRGPTPINTRASDAGSFISTGVFALVGGNDQPRFHHDPDDSDAQLGFLWEQERIQIGKQTSNLAGDQWTAINSDVPTENNTDIFGGTAADELAATSTADQQVARHQSYTGLTADVNTGVAAHIKTGTNASFVQLAWDSDGSGADGCFCNFQLTGSGTKGAVTAMTAGTATRADIKLTTQGFYRCSVVGKIASGTVGRFTINIVDRIDAAKFEAADLADNDSLIVDAIDVQVGPFMLSHIPNAGGAGTSVTRAKDTTSVVVSSVYVAGGGAILLNFIMNFGNNGERFLNANGANIAFFQQSTSHPDAEISTFDGTSSFNVTNQMTLGVVGKVALSWDVGGRSLVLNGGAVATGTANMTNFDAVTGFAYGEGAGTQIDSMTYQTLRYQNVRPSDGSLVTETT